MTGFRLRAFRSYSIVESKISGQGIWPNNFPVLFECGWAAVVGTPSFTTFQASWIIRERGYRVGALIVTSSCTSWHIREINPSWAA